MAFILPGHAHWTVRHSWDRTCRSTVVFSWRFCTTPLPAKPTTCINSLHTAVRSPFRTTTARSQQPLCAFHRTPTHRCFCRAPRARAHLRRCRLARSLLHLPLPDNCFTLCCRFMPLTPARAAPARFCSSRAHHKLDGPPYHSSLCGSTFFSPHTPFWLLSIATEGMFFLRCLWSGSHLPLFSACGTTTPPPAATPAFGRQHFLPRLTHLDRHSGCPFFWITTFGPPAGWVRLVLIWMLDGMDCRPPHLPTGDH